MNEHNAPITAVTVSVAEAKARFSELLKLAADGVEVHITKHGKPLAKLAPHSTDAAKRRIGAFAHVPLDMADDFDDLGPEWGPYLR